MSNPQVVQTVISRIQAQEFDAIFMSPPCNTWSRAPHSNSWGPCPVRNRLWPRGFPWADGKFFEQALLGNLLVDVCFTICSLVCNDPWCPHVKSIWEHPEDLGAAWDAKGRKVFPASIWQLPEMDNLLKQPSWITVAFFQCSSRLIALNRQDCSLTSRLWIVWDWWVPLNLTQLDGTLDLCRLHVLMVAILLLSRNGKQTTFRRTGRSHFLSMAPPPL